MWLLGRMLDSGMASTLLENASGRARSAAGFLTLAVALAAPGPARAQTGFPPVAYTARQLACVGFRESSRSSIRTESGGRVRENSAGRDGLLVMHGEPAAAAIRLEAWYDSLALWRKSPEATVTPDTDGLLGGRFRGTLTPDGHYRAEARPFVPDEVAEVAEVAGTLEDYLPPLPPRQLRPGERWRDSTGVEIQRLADSALSGVPLYRFAVSSRREGSKPVVPGDSVPVEMTQVTEERGTFVWHPMLGVLRRERHIVADAAVPAGGRVRRAVRSRIEQQIVIQREPDAACPAPE
jgi:hypothetical protein